MSEPAKNINYSASDIVRYLGGHMTASEMHEIERAALQDAFLADAIDGYRDSNITQTKMHLNEITAALYAKKEDSKIIPIQSNKNTWFRIAALIILLAGVGAAGWYFLSMQNKQESNINVAQVKAEKTVASQPDSILLQQQKSNSAINNSPTQPANVLLPNSKKGSVENSGNGKVVILSSGGTASTSFNEKQENNNTYTFNEGQDSILRVEAKGGAADQALDETIAKAPSNIKPETAISGEAAGIQLSKSKETNPSYHNINFTGKVTDNQKAPIPFATILLTDSKTSVTTDANGIFTIANIDSNVSISVSAVGFENKNVELNAKRDNTISLEKDNSALSEVVVTGYDVKKSSSIISHHEGLIPKGGWPSFERYFNQQLSNQNDAEEDATIITGTFEIAFSIDDNGKPDSIMVLNSIDEKANNKIIDLIKNGPRWVGDKDHKKGNITFRFP